MRNPEAAAGLVLVVAATLAMVFANSPLVELYLAIFTASPVRHGINDGLMAVFFLAVALEIKRELKGGELSSPAQALLPAVAALGGMVVPAALYLAVVGSDSEAARGWAIPAATDIAFALGVLALFGRAVPPGLRIFLAALAIIDDLGAVVIIALYYAGDLSLPHLGGVATALVMLLALNLGGVRRLWPYLVVGMGLWGVMLGSGIHATLAGVLTGLVIPAGQPLHRLEAALKPWVGFVIVPIFAFANAGLPLDGFAVSGDRVPIAVALALFLGKQAGVVSTSWLLIRFGPARLPEGCGWPMFYGACLLTGIGFTMSLFIAALAFAGGGEGPASARMGVLVGSLASAVAGSVVLAVAARRSRQAG
jgi:NhaA family Na+:H+ antiporter